MLAVVRVGAESDGKECCGAQGRPRSRRPDTPTRRPIDRIHLARQTLGDQSLALEVLRMYDEMAATYFARLETSTNRNDLMVNLHALQGRLDGHRRLPRSPNWRGPPRTSCGPAMPVNPERIDDIGIAVEEVRHFIADMLRGRTAQLSRSLARSGQPAAICGAHAQDHLHRSQRHPPRDRGRARLDRDGDRHHERRARDHRRVRRRLHLRDLPRLCRRGLDARPSAGRR